MDADSEENRGDMVGAGCMGALLALLPVMFLAMAGSDLIHPSLQGTTLKLACLALWLLISAGVYAARNVRPHPRFARAGRGVLIVLMGAVGSMVLRQSFVDGEYSGPSRLFYLMWISPFLVLYGLGLIVSAFQQE